jgi:hypothetical protein
MYVIVIILGVLYSLISFEFTWHMKSNKPWRNTAVMRTEEYSLQREHTIFYSGARKSLSLSPSRPSYMSTFLVPTCPSPSSKSRPSSYSSSSSSLVPSELSLAVQHVSNFHFTAGASLLLHTDKPRRP